MCSETCVGRIRYLGVLLYDADRIEEAASTEREVDLYERQCEVFLDPHDPSVIEEALKQGIPQNVIACPAFACLQNGDGLETGATAAP